MLTYWTAFSIGLLGSFHCVGMCGPIALALPIGGKSNFGKGANILLYNLGRVSTYATFGAVFGALGKGFVMAGFQQSVSIGAGILILLSVFPFGKWLQQFSPNHKVLGFTNRVKIQLGKQFLKGSSVSIFAIGMLNGLLPCGLVYIAIAGAIATGNAFSGSAFMALFGLGTVPIMFSLFIAGNTISINFRNKIKRVIPVVVAIVGVLFIIRGMNLGIPYVSPKMSYQTAEAACCHKPK